MVIHQLFTEGKKNTQRTHYEEVTQDSSGLVNCYVAEHKEEVSEGVSLKRDRVFNGVITRLLFLFLFVSDLIWGAYNLILCLVSLLGVLCTFNRVLLFSGMLARSYLNIKRFAVCLLALFVALFCPTFGIMIACSYFFLYDKSALEEIVPSAIKEQFQDLFQAASD